MNDSERMTYDELTRKQLETSFNRLSNFIFRLNTPPTIVAHETAMLVERIALRYGTIVYQRMGEVGLQRAAREKGFCPFHSFDSMARLSRPVVDPANGSVMCADCWKSATEDDAEAERLNAEDGDDDANA